MIVTSGLGHRPARRADHHPALGLLLAAGTLAVALSACAGPAPSGSSSSAASAASAASVAAPIAAPASGAPVLGAPDGPGVVGLGTARPSTIDPGGHADRVIEGVTWTDWGGPTATGTGSADWVAPGAPSADATQERAVIVASDLGDCHGTLAYRQLGWYFPQHQETGPARRSGSICPG